MSNELQDQSRVICRHLYGKLEIAFPNTKHLLPKKGTAPYERWIKEAELLLRRDKADFEDVISVINWIFDGGNDGFWVPNVRSTQKLRKHFDRLLMQRDRDLKRNIHTHDPPQKNPPQIFPDDWRDIVLLSYPKAVLPSNPMNLPTQVKKELFTNGTTQQIAATP